MKKPGSICDFAADRASSIMQAYRRAALTCGKIDVATIAAEVVGQPSPRFWVSEERAMAVVAAVMRGADPTPAMIPTKQRMFREICRRVFQRLEQSPALSVYDIVCEVVNQPAPEYYMSPRYASDIIYDTLRNTKRPRR